MNEVQKAIKDRHPMGWKGILFGYPTSKIFGSNAFYISCVLMIIASFITGVSKIPYQEHLVALAELNLSTYTNLLGFNLGGYAIIIGFGNTDLIKRLIKPQGDDKSSSYFQDTSSIFAFSIIVQSIVLISSFFISILNKVHIWPVLERFNFLTCSIEFLSAMLYHLLLLVCIYGLVLIPYIVKNVFSFGQMHHGFLTKQKIEVEQKEALEKLAESSSEKSTKS